MKRLILASLLSCLTLPALATQPVPVAVPVGVAAVTAAQINSVLSSPDTTSLALGSGTLTSQTGTNNRNTALGVNVLTNATGTNNTGCGFAALGTLSTGFENTACGTGALNNATSGSQNTVFGFHAGLFITTGGRNVFIGDQAGNAQTNTPLTANENVGVGFAALNSVNATGTGNTGLGFQALLINTTGTGNIAIGDKAGATVLTTGSNNILIGNGVTALTATANNGINIGGTIFGNTATGRIGINQTAPSYTLDVTGAIAANGDICNGTKFTTTGCAVSATTGGSCAGTYTSGTTGTCTVVITINSTQPAPNGWACFANDRTTNTDIINNSASTQTTCTLSGPTVSGDVISWSAKGY